MKFSSPQPPGAATLSKSLIATTIATHCSPSTTDDATRLYCRTTTRTDDSPTTATICSRTTTRYSKVPHTHCAMSKNLSKSPTSDRYVRLSLSARISPTFQPWKQCFSLTTKQPYKSAAATVSLAKQGNGSMRRKAPICASFSNLRPSTFGSVIFLLSSLRENGMSAAGTAARGHSDVELWMVNSVDPKGFVRLAEF